MCNEEWNGVERMRERAAHKEKEMKIINTLHSHVCILSRSKFVCYIHIHT